MRRIACLAGVALLTLATSARAQAGREGQEGREVSQVLSASPILLMYKMFNVDYERRIAPALTLGASGSYLPIDGFDYGRASLHARFYPQRAALTGFYIGAQTGVHRAGSRRDHEMVFGAGMDLGYAWLFGPKRDVSLTLGFGTTRLFGGDLGDGSFTIPNARLFNVGFAF